MVLFGEVLLFSVRELMVEKLLDLVNMHACLLNFEVICISKDENLEQSLCWNHGLLT